MSCEASTEGRKRRLSINAIVMRYEMNSPATTSEVTAFSAAVDPTLISAKRRLIKQDAPMEYSGSCVRGSTYLLLVTVHDGGTRTVEHTRLRYSENGRPLSRANAHIIREEVVKHAAAPKMTSATIKDVIAVLPAMESVAW